MQAAVDSMQVYREAQLQQAATAQPQAEQAATAQPQPEQQHAAQPQPEQQPQLQATPLPTSGAKRPRGGEHDSSDSEDDLDVCLSDFDAEDCSDWDADAE